MENKYEIIISKEDFIDAINDVMEVNDYQTGLNKYFREHDVDGYIFQPDCICTVIRLLHMAFGTLDDDEWISYFCFEMDFGRKWKPGTIAGRDGTDLRLSSAEELYDYLVSLREGDTK